MRIRSFFISAIALTALSGCVPGTVEYDDSGGWEPAESSADSETESSEDSPEQHDSTQNDNEPDTREPVEDEPSTDPPLSDPESECSAGQDMCASMCVDMTSDPEHCGACDNACPSGASCAESACVCDAQTEEVCGGTCVDTTSSTQHCGGCDMPCAGGMICSSGACVENTEVAAVLAETNAARASGADCGVYGELGPTDPIEGDPDLHEAAQAHAEDMAENDFFSHTGSDGSSFVDRVRRTDYAGAPMGENIAAGYGSPSAVVAGWVDSDGHCRNLMNSGATKIGIGYTTGGPYGTLWVQVFGR